MGIGVADAEGDQGSHVAEHGVADLGFELGHVLVGDGQVERLSRHLRASESRETKASVVKFWLRGDSKRGSFSPKHRKLLL